MDVSIIIVNYKTAQLIKNCIDSILRWTSGIKYEIIVVDNDSHDDCHEMLESYKDKACTHFVGLDENIGFGRANNKGFEIATGRNVLCLNPDTLLLNNAIKELSDYLDAHPEVGACGGNLYDEQMRPAWSFCALPSIVMELDILFLNRLYPLLYGKNIRFNHTEKPLEVGYITGADLMVKGGIIRGGQRFSADFFMYYEETDLCCRIRRKGYKIMSVPSAKIQHLEGKSFKQNDEINARALTLNEQGRKTYYRHNASWMHAKLADLVYELALRRNVIFFKWRGNPCWKVYHCRLQALKAAK